ncbi:zinc finger CCCH-type antiviral protein 1-like isoform X2 [Engystomops pustulosus]|uniref:zinc finger CCCH-type antiviral protein 1-like isoform X2 n=1 Tax=Engystomops pustulosus TaxID=76066 RepID=UPI003AFAEEEF
MSDPTVTAFLTKILCSHGGRLSKDLLSGYLDLSREQIEQILEDEPQKFPVVGDLVLARSPVRICPKYLKNEPEEECDKLHLCRFYLQGKCRRKFCQFPHDFSSDQNRKILKANEIIGLNDEEVKVLLLQNDHQLLPEVCWGYARGTCDLGAACSRLHVCEHFLRGECNYRSCKRSHHLLEFGSELLLVRCRIPEISVQNFQMICAAKHIERLQTLRDEGNRKFEKGNPGDQRGRARGRPQNRTKGDSNLSQIRRRRQYPDIRGASFPNMEAGTFHPAASSPPSTPHDLEPTVTTSSPSPTPHDLEPTVTTSYRGEATYPTASPMGAPPGPSGEPVLPSSNSSAPAPNPTTTPLPTTEPSRPAELLMDGPSVEPPTAPSGSPTGPSRLPDPLTKDLEEKSTTSPAAGPNSGQPVTTSADRPPTTPSVPPTSPGSFVNSTTKGSSVPQDKPKTTSTVSPNSGHPMATITPVTSYAGNPSYPRAGPSRLEGPSLSQKKPVKSILKSHAVPDNKPTYTSHPAVVSPTRVDPDKVPEICLSHVWKHCKLGNRCPDVHYYLPYCWQIYKGTDWEDVSDMEEIERQYCDPKVDRVSMIDFRTMKSGVHRVRRLSTVSSVTKPSEYVLTTEWLWYWQDEYGTWTQYGHSNVKNVSSTSSSSDLEKMYLSKPTTLMSFKAGNQHYVINFREMKQMNIVYETEKAVRRRPKYLSFEDVKLLRGSTKSAAAKSPLKSPLKSDIYPKTWDTKALPEIGCAKVQVSDTIGEFSEIVSIFTKTVRGQVVKKLWRLQNSFLWNMYQGQKEQMKKLNQGRDVKEIRLFHGTDKMHVDAICNHNFDWRICGTHGTVYGQGSYFARDASYSHDYSTPTSGGSRMMFVARVLVGDYVKGNPQMKRPPTRLFSSRFYDSCVDDATDPSIYVVFEKLQIYPEYLLEYEEQKQKSCVIS